MPGEQTADTLLAYLIHQRQCFTQRGAWRLFYQHVFACGQRLLYQCESTLRRCAKRNSIDPRAVFKQQIGRASCRERVCKSVENDVVVVSLKKKENKV